MADLTVVVLFIHYLVHLLIYCAVTLYQSWLNYKSDSDEYDESGGYEKSGRLYQIHGRGEAKFVTVYQRRHFITSYSGRTHPEQALEPHVTLLSVTDTEAIFGIPNRNIDIYDVKQWPFAFIAQFNLIEELLILPIDSMIRLANQLGDPKPKVLWISGTGRCGSTLMAQVFNSLPNVVSISEPHSLFSLQQRFLYKNLQLGLDTKGSARYKKIFRSTVRLMLKPTLQKDVKLIAYKAPPMGSILDAELVADMFPNFKQVFMYRDVKPQTLSMQTTVGGHDIVFMITTFLNRYPIISHIAQLFQVYPQQLVYNTCDDPEHIERLFSPDILSNISSFGGFVISWAALCHHYKCALNEIPEAKLIAIKFEELKKDTPYFIKELLKFCDFVPTDEGWQEVMSVLEADSQQGSYVSQKRASNAKVNLTERLIAEANNYLTFYEFSAFEEPCFLPRTLCLPSDN